MKIQDVVFLMLFALLVYKQNPKWSATLGLLFLLASIPLFSLWIFFTAERLVWYGAAFFLLCILQNLVRKQVIK
ncbi:MAG: hypothetical protein WD992_01165 [Candidatus Levyibacteriota bacterium]